jgi:hypothetical protein
MARPDTVLEFRLTRNHTVIVLVSVVDRRIVPALHFVSRLGYADTRALHVSIDADETRRLAADWMNLGLSWLPLHIRDATAPGLPASVRDAVQRERGATESVTVVLPELDSARWWYPLLHRRSARRIAAQLQPLPGVTAVIVPFFVPPRNDASAPAAGKRLVGRSTQDVD